MDKVRAIWNVICRWFFQSLLALDQFGNAFLLFGWADESISARAWRLSGDTRRWVRWPWSVARLLIDLGARLFGEKDHCFEAYTSERLRTQLPPEERN